MLMSLNKSTPNENNKTEYDFPKSDEVEILILTVTLGSISKSGSCCQNKCGSLNNKILTILYRVTHQVCQNLSLTLM